MADAGGVGRLPDLPAGLERPRPDDAAGPQPALSPPRTVLLVEDNDDNRVIYCTLLRHVGYRVVEAADGEAALALARDERPDLVLMDVTLPVLDGLAATRRLKADPATGAIPVIALTAHASAESRAACLDAGCDSYLAKPIAPRDVLREVERLLASRSG